MLAKRSSGSAATDRILTEYQAIAQQDRNKKSARIMKAIAENNIS
jgi:hypothetical protein